MNDYLKHLFIRTPLERPLSRLRGLLGYRWRRAHPELVEIFAEPARIEQVVRRILGESSNCIDIGCHLGSMLNLIVTLAPKGRHMAFEAMPQKAKWLKRKFPEVDVRAMALSDRAGDVTFYQNVKKTGFSGLRPHADPGDRLAELVVPCERLDAVVPEQQRVDFIKLDVEGAELLVLRGGEKLLRQQRPSILFECTTSGLTQFDVTPRDMYRYLTEGLPYRVYLLKSWLNGDAPLEFGAFEKAMVYPFQAFNFVATPRE